MERICIIGGSGTGKTTLSNNLGKALNLPVYHIDAIHHLENWKIRDEAERDKIILDIINNDKWVVDGTYRSTLKERLERADYVIYLDYSSIAQVRGVLSRFIKDHGKERPEIPGCKERMSLKFLLWVIKWRKNKRQIIIDNLQKVDNSKVYIFKTRRQLNKWYKNKFNTKIELI